MRSLKKNRLIIGSLSVILLIGVVLSASHIFQTDSFSDALKVKIQEKLFDKSEIGLFSVERMKTFYKSIDYKASWTNRDASMYEISDLLESLNSAESDGLILRDYHRGELKQKFLYYQQWINDKQADSLAEFDILLTDACLKYAWDISKGQLSADRDENPKSTPFETGLVNALDSQRVNVWLRSLPPNNCAYQELKEALLYYKNMDANNAFVKPDDSIMDKKPGDSGDQVLRLRQFLNQTGDIGSQISSGSKVFDSTLENGVRNFQYRNGLHETGIVDMQTLQTMNIADEERVGHIMASMERLRWLPPDLGEKYVQVNITDFSLKVIENYSTRLKMKVIVGKPYKQTPVFHSNITYVVFNPSWEIPRSIMTKEILAALKKNPSYLEAHHMQIFDQNGTEINADTIHWQNIDAERFNFRIKQMPGSWNSLGRIKFYLPNPYNVYLHGTPDQYLFARDVRTFSHGCMRVEDPLSLAVCLLKNMGYDKKEIEEQLDNDSETSIVIKPYVPVNITYQTAWIDGDDRLCFRDDIYGRDAIFVQYAKKERSMLKM